MMWTFVISLAAAACSARSDTTTSVIKPAPTTTLTAESGTMLVVGDPVPGLDLFAAVNENDLNADRINVVLAPWGWSDQSEFEAFVLDSLSWAGDAYLYDSDGVLTDDPGDAFGAGMGVFGIEPWRSSRDKFNVWYTDVEPDTPVSWLNRNAVPFAISDLVIVAVAIDADRFNAELTSVSGLDFHFDGPDSLYRPPTGNPFAHSMVVVDSAFPAGALIDLPHELGHGLFGLSDEYVGERYGVDGGSNVSSWPSCASDPNEANLWWGDLIGSIDPMLEIWINEMETAGFPVPDPEWWEGQVTVDAVHLGCYGVSGSARATIDSLMNSGIPVLGSVNRRWAESILDLWEGQPRVTPVEHD